MAGASVGEMLKIDEDLIMKACSVAMKAHRFQNEPFLVENSSGFSSSVAIFSFPGSWSEKDWFSNDSFGAKPAKGSVFSEYLRSLGNDEAAVLNEAFLHRFESIRTQLQIKVCDSDFFFSFFWFQLFFYFWKLGFCSNSNLSMP